MEATSKSGGSTYILFLVVSFFFFFLKCEIKFDCINVAVCDLVHDGETPLTANSIWKSFLKYEC